MTKVTVNWQPEILESDLLKIVPLIEADFDNLYKAASDPIIWEQHPANDRYKLEVFKPYFDGAIAGKSAFKIIDKSTNQMIGSTRYYDYNPEKSGIAIGFTFLAKEYWGGTYNKSVKKLMIDYAFQFVDIIYFHIGVTNIRSQKAIQKIGAIKRDEINFENNGQSLPHFEYLIKKQSWINE
ncbi:MAG: GNAT family N-acetyltransferase [Prolixibacteraceae bacterium]|nr:GNAT family N-acetyltransferase [Prolixibacteraceae bacterium]